jgi:uncharacterized membrane protein
MVEELDGSHPVLGSRVGNLLGCLGHVGIETQTVAVGEASGFAVYRNGSLAEGNRRHQQPLSWYQIIDEIADFSEGLA